MHILWKLREAVVRDIIKELGPPEPKYTTISSVVRILVEKGFAGYKSFGRTHVYHPIISKEEYKRFAFKQFMQDYFDDSYKNVVSFIVHDEALSKDEVDDIQSLIDEISTEDE